MTGSQVAAALVDVRKLSDAGADHIAYGGVTVVVINKAKEALFFQECDYGLVGDYEQVVPVIAAALQ